MSLFNFFSSKTTKIEHSFFGQMRFIDDKKAPNKSYFECKRFFKPSDTIIHIGITASIEGPMENQIDFFESIETNYTEITKSIIPLIEDEFRNWKEDFTIQNFKSEFQPVYINIPKCDVKPIVWEIAFESEHDRNHTFTCTMQNDNAIEILIDG
jgi:hypothetical protein